MTPDTAAIRARAEKATPGPWTISAWSENVDGIFLYGCVGPNAPRIALIQFGVNYGQKICEETEANALLIVSARTDVPALCDEIDAERAEIDRLRAELAAKDDAVRVYINAMPARIAQATANAQDDLLTRIKKHIRHHLFAKQAIPLWRDISAEVDALRAAAQKEKAG